jgi:hypothetical protein
LPTRTAAARSDWPPKIPGSLVTVLDFTGHCFGYAKNLLDRLNLIGLSPAEVGQQLQLLLTGVAVTQVREDIRNVPIVARSAGGERLDPTRLADFSLMSRDGRPIPLDQIGHSEVRLDRISSGRLSDRNGWIDRGGGQGQHRAR